MLQEISDPGLGRDMMSRNETRRGIGCNLDAGLSKLCRGREGRGSERLGSRKDRGLGRGALYLAVVEPRAMCRETRVEGQW